MNPVDFSPASPAPSAHPTPGVRRVPKRIGWSASLIQGITGALLLAGSVSSHGTPIGTVVAGERTGSSSEVNSVPDSATLGLFGLGLAGILAGIRFVRHRRNS